MIEYPEWLSIRDLFAVLRDEKLLLVAATLFIGVPIRLYESDAG